MEQQLGYRDFLELMCSRVNTALGERSMDGQFRLGKIVKNNGVILDTLDFSSDGIRTSPAIHLRELYRKYSKGVCIDSIAAQVCETLTDFDGKEHLIDPERFLDYERIRDHIWMKAVNWELNEKQLQSRPHLRKLDLALCFYIQMHMADGSACSCEVTQGLADLWQTSAEDLYQRALENITRDWEILFQPLDDILWPEDPDEGCCPGELAAPMDPAARIFILSSRENCAGAVLMFISDRIRQLAEIEQRDIFILPSSIHEVLLLADNHEMNAKSLKEIVMSVNRSTVDAQEVLSDHVYRYIRGEDRIVIEA